MNIPYRDQLQYVGCNFVLLLVSDENISQVCKALLLLAKILQQLYQIPFHHIATNIQLKRSQWGVFFFVENITRNVKIEIR